MTRPVAIVTAAGRGLGAGIATELAAAGYELALMSSSGGAEALAARLGGLGMTGSVTEPADLAGLVEWTLDSFGRVDAVVNNTGHPARGELLELTDQDWHAGLDLLLLNVVRMARLVTPIMRDQGGGAIVNVSTFAAVEPDPAFPVSASLRAALAAFTKLYADRHAAAAIRMNNVLPGHLDNHPPARETLVRIPAGRYGRVAEAAATVRFLLSAEASYLTGQSIRVDGGLTRSI